MNGQVLEIAAIVVVALLLAWCARRRLQRERSRNALAAQLAEIRRRIEAFALVIGRELLPPIRAFTQALNALPLADLAPVLRAVETEES